jgi:hypothetical protein
MRHVLVKVELEATLLLSGNVTSATKAALLVQSGEFVGRGVGVKVTLAASGGDSVVAGIFMATTD